MQTPREFDEDLSREQRHSGVPIWEKIYNELFDPVEIIRVSDINQQMRGVDRIVKCEGQTHRIEEKIQYKAYNNLCIERWSDLEGQGQGWALKELQCDYVLFLCWQTTRYWLIPFQQLRNSLIENLYYWERDYKVVTIRNKGRRGNFYTSVAVCIPINVLRECIPGMKSGRIR